MQTFISIHDVSPQVLPQVKTILNLLSHYQLPPVMLLVIPGANWKTADLAQLRTWQNQGYRLAGHGWQHYCNRPTSVYHWLHSRCISRHVAEHLSLDNLGIANILNRCYNWFKTHDLKAPNYYVPPAWAMGSISQRQLTTLPFRYYEYFSGVYDTQLNQYYYSPMLGFEADNTWRKYALSIWNTGNHALANKTQRCLRIAIHPYDLEYHLHDQLEYYLQINAKNHFPKPFTLP